MSDWLLGKVKEIISDFKRSGLQKVVNSWYKKRKKDIDALGKQLHKNGISAHMISIFGFVIGMMSVNFLAMNMYFEALICILINPFCDLLDGAVARLDGVSSFGQFLDTCLDLIFYAGVIFGFALAQPEDNALVACFLLFGFMASAVALLAYGAVCKTKNRSQSKEDEDIQPFYFGGFVQGAEVSVCVILLCLMPFAFLPLAIALGCWCLVKALVIITTAYYKFVIAQKSRKL